MYVDVALLKVKQKKTIRHPSQAIMPIAFARKNGRSVSPSALDGFNDESSQTKSMPSSPSRSLRIKWTRRRSMPALCEKSEQLTPLETVAQDREKHLGSRPLRRMSSPGLLEAEDDQQETMSTTRLKSCMSVSSLQESLSQGPINEAPSKPKRTVSFHKVEFRNFHRTLGDHPSSRGAPITLSWQYDPSHPTLSIDDYETYRPPRRSRSQIYMSSYHREEILMSENISPAAIRKAKKEVSKVREQRQKTVETLHNAPVEEAMESAKRRLKQFVNRSSERKEETMLWKEASKYAETRVRQKSAISSPSTTRTIEVLPRKRQEEAEQLEEVQAISNCQMGQGNDGTFIGEDDDVPLSF